MGNIKELHVVGYKNSGKTTLISRWVCLLKSEGKTVSVIKQHGHTKGKLKMPDAGTDSMLFFESGADLSIVSGGGAVQIMMNETSDFTRLKQLATINRPDVLLIEGFKEEQGDKVVLLKEDNDWETLQSVQGINLVVGEKEGHLYPTIANRKNVAELDKWFLKWLY